MDPNTNESLGEDFDIFNLGFILNDTLRNSRNNSEISKWVFITNLSLLGCTLLISVFGLLANIINIEVFMKLGLKDCATIMFFSMSCSDLAFLVLSIVKIIFTLLIGIEITKKKWILSIDPTLILYYSENCAFVMYSMTILTAGLMAILRCVCMTKPIKFKQSFTKLMLMKIMILLYLLPICCQTVVFSNMGIQSKYDPVKNATRFVIWFSKDREKVKDIVRLILSSILPLAVEFTVITCLFIIVYTLRNSANYRLKFETSTWTQIPKLSRKDIEPIKQIILILTIFLLLNLFGIITSFLTAFDSRFEYGKSYQTIFSVLHTLRALCETANASVNIFVYFFYNSRFRAVCLASGQSISRGMSRFLNDTWVEILIWCGIFQRSTGYSGYMKDDFRMTFVFCFPKNA